jgi:ribosomal protein L11 methyltransferase
VGRGKEARVTAVRVNVRAEDEDVAAAILWDAGTQGIEIGNHGSESHLLAYFGGPVAVQDLRASLASLAGASAEVVEVPDVDWVARFRENFRAFAAGPFWVAPAWDEPTGGSYTIVVDPGRAFGTGTHESTRLCLAALARLAGERGLGRTLDVGTGTGILAIAALKLGALQAFGVDVDPESMEAARTHARLNHVAPHLCLADGAAAFRAGVFDTVLANVSAAVLRGRRNELGRVLAPRGVLVLSGLLTEDVSSIRAEYQDLGEVHVTIEGEWAAVTVRRS